MFLTQAKGHCSIPFSIDCAELFLTKPGISTLATRKTYALVQHVTPPKHNLAGLLDIALVNWKNCTTVRVQQRVAFAIVSKLMQFRDK